MLITRSKAVTTGHIGQVCLWLWHNYTWPFSARIVRQGERHLQLQLGKLWLTVWF